MKTARKIESFFGVFRVIIAVLIAYMISLIALTVISDEPVMAIRQFIVGPFSTIRRSVDMVALATLFTFTGLCMCFMYAVNKFNLSAEGIVIISGCMTTYLGIQLQGIPKGILLPVLLLTSILIGMAAAAIPAVLNARFDAHVVVVSLMLNYILFYLSQFILKYGMKDVSMPSLASLKYPEELKLAVLVPKTEIHAGLIIAAVCVVLVVIAIYKTPFGYAMRTVGSNPNFAKYAGISVTGTVVAAQIIGGAFAGLGGAVEILGRYERFRWLEMPNYGFDGLIVAVMAHRNPALVPVGALLLAYIRTGADIVTRTTDIPAEFVSIVQGIIILLIAAEMFLSGLKRRMIFKSARESLENTEKQQEAVKA